MKGIATGGGQQCCPVPYAQCPIPALAPLTLSGTVGQVPAFTEGKTKGVESEPPCSGQGRGPGFTQPSAAHFLLGSAPAEHPERMPRPRPGAVPKGRGLGAATGIQPLPPPESGSSR